MTTDTHPDITLRALTTDDVPAWNRLLAAAEEVDRTGEHYNEADLLEELANPDIEIGKDVVGAFAGDLLAGFYLVYPRSSTDGYHKVILVGAVHPELRGRGLGTQLAAAMHRRALEAHRERHPDLPLLLTLRGPAEDAAQRELMAGIGLTPERWSFTMRADLADVPGPGRTVPEDLELRRWTRELDPAMREAHNAAFVDHPNFSPWSEAMWRQWVSESRSFRPELSYLVVPRDRPETVVAYLQTSEFDAYQAATGRREAYVAKVGTRREHRGRGLAGILLSRALGEYHQAGYDEASLDVDSRNPTGALGIYERAGFAVESRWADYERTLDPTEVTRLLG
jgi:mycothiol synthase